MLKSSKVFLHSLDLLLKRLDQAIPVLHVVVISVLFSDRLVSLGLLPLNFQLQLLQFLLLCLVAELKAFKVTLELVFGGLGFFQVTSELNKLFILFMFQGIAVSS